jgi:diaminopimelate decarboxylase
MTDKVKIGGCDVEALAKEYGTPLYVLDIQAVRKVAADYLSIKNYYNNSRVSYASKALSLTALYQVLEQEGFFFDVVSDGEFYTMLNAGVSADKAYFHGNNKTINEIKYALEQEIGVIVVDNVDELNTIHEVYTTLGITSKVTIMVRIVPEIEAHTHEFVRTGQRDSKFGVHLENVISFVATVKKYKEFDFVGFHAHIGSQIFDTDPYHVLIDKLIDLAVDVHKKTGVLASAIDIGGGIGIKYVKDDDPPSVREFVASIAESMKSALERVNYPIQPLLILEPGRSIVANAGVTIYSVGGVKEIKGLKNYISVDGGMADNPRPITYGSVYSADIINKSKDSLKKYSVAGKFCESGDVLLKDIELPEAQKGDLLMVYATGAYNYSMSSNYNRYRKPAMVFVENNKAKLVLKRETLEDIIRNDVRID